MENHATMQGDGAFEDGGGDTPMHTMNNQLYVTGGSRDMENHAILTL